MAAVIFRLLKKIFVFMISEVYKFRLHFSVKCFSMIYSRHCITLKERIKNGCVRVFLQLEKMHANKFTFPIFYDLNFFFHYHTEINSTHIFCYFIRCSKNFIVLYIQGFVAITITHMFVFIITFFTRKLLR